MRKVIVMMNSVLSQNEKERGQSFMELAVSLLFLLTLVSATVDLGWAFYTMTALRDVAQEGGSYGSMCSNPALVRKYVKASASAPIDMNELDDSTIAVCYTRPGQPACMTNMAAVDRGDSVRITITYMHRIVTPFIGAAIGKQEYPLVVEVTDTVLAPKACP